MDFVPKERVEEFNEYFMDWNFRDGSVIWTGKGDRKFNNIKYVKAKKEFDRYKSATTRCWV